MAQEEKNPGKSPKQVAEILGIGHLETHFFVCTGPDCCTPETGMETWQAVKAKVKELYPRLSEAKMYRSKVGCLRICKQGPIAVAYPQGKWFQGVTPDKVDELLDYLNSGSTEPHPLEFKTHPLPART
ncbi:MAG: (2Fe-2S) ferredoxin domain-containing protein [SAR324 cluster bacterium]|nr:(2Fe-2S) ferredoxin domain-containing protein [SAR324 cluster bacterium]